MRYLIGVDIGTSGTKTVLFDENGTKIYVNYGKKTEIDNIQIPEMDFVIV